MLKLIGDVHGELEKIYREINRSICDVKNTDNNLYVAILGDAGINFYLDSRDKRNKESLQKYISNIKEDFGVDVFLLFVRGNHDCHPKSICSYRIVQFEFGEVYMEADYPNLLFLKDGEIYNIDDLHFLVIGGGNSSDYFERILNGYPFFNDEALDYEEMNNILDALPQISEDFAILSHMLPESVSPNYGKTSIATNSVEEFLQRIMKNIKGKKISWYAGHYHKDSEFTLGDIKYHILYNSSVCL